MLYAQAEVSNPYEGNPYGRRKSINMYPFQF